MKYVYDCEREHLLRMFKRILSKEMIGRYFADGKRGPSKHVDHESQTMFFLLLV